jgi:arylformamidase
VVYIHGGYWRVMTKDFYSFVAPPFVEAGWNVAVLEYDLCPAVTIHQITDQCRRAIAWISHHAADFGVGCEEIVICGHSAGGHLTAMMFTTHWQDYGVDARVFTGGIAISGLYDLDPIAQTAMNNELKLNLDDVLALSPARRLPKMDTRLVLSVGALESDEFHRQISVLRGVPAWQAITAPPVVIPDRHHFNVVDDFMNLDGAMWSALR